MSAAITASGPTVAARRTAGTAEMIGPMMGRSSRIPAVTDNSSAYRPKIGSTNRLSTSRPMNVNRPTAKPRTNWARTHWLRTRSMLRRTTIVSNRHDAGRARSNDAARLTRSLSR